LADVEIIEFAVIGSGPAGLAAAAEAAHAGVKVTLIDENSRPGGQLFKQIHKFFGSENHGAGTRGIDLGRIHLERALAAGVDVRLDTVCWGITSDLELALWSGNATHRVKAQRVAIATGASENALAFPGWTLPGVMGAGAAQTMINLHRVLPGQHALMVGSGNVGLIVAYQMLQAGMDVAAVLEALPRVGGYAVHAAKIARAGVPVLTRHTISEVTGDGRVERATIVALGEDGRALPSLSRTLDVDVVCLAVGLTPLAELAWIAGCRFAYIPELGGHVPLHDESMESTVPGLYVAGDITGIEEASTAMEEGRLAGLSVALSLCRISRDEYDTRRMGIDRALAEIRQGPFGEKLGRAKAELLEQRKTAV
jgi:thioredoxin reductase